MDEATASDVVERLRARGVFAHVNRRAGVYNVGVRVVIPDGREAIWDNDGAAGLEAMVLRDGVLVGFVPELPDSEQLDAATVADIIAGTDYDATPAAPPQTDREAPPQTDRPPQPQPGGQPPAPVVEQPEDARGWLDRLLRRG